MHCRARPCDRSARGPVLESTVVRNSGASYNDRNRCNSRKALRRTPRPLWGAREGPRETGSQELLVAKSSSVRSTEQVFHAARRPPSLYCEQEGSDQGNQARKTTYPMSTCQQACSGGNGDRCEEAPIRDGGAGRRKPSEQPKWETGPDPTLLCPSDWKMVAYILWSLPPLYPLLGRTKRDGIPGEQRRLTALTVVRG